uniref:UBX domain-containing protein n=1 Tax=Mesocestoides corti TaxID=53468 RepID=A0A5K3EWC5_MESCO
MDLVNQFQEITGICDEDLAKDILEQFDWDIEAAANDFLNDTKSADSPQSGSKSPPAVPPRRPKRVLNFEITFYLDENQTTSVVAKLPNIPDSYTVGDLKQSFIDRYSTELTECATRNGLVVDRKSFLFLLRFDELKNQSGINNNVTLRSLHLPLNNCWTARLSTKPRPLVLGVNPHEVPSPSSSSSIDLQIRLPRRPLLNTTVTTNGAGSGLLNLHLDATTSLTALKRQVERDTQIPVPNQRWSLAAGCTSRARLDDMVRDLNSPSTSSSSHTLQHYNLRSGRTYNFSLKYSQTASLQDSSAVERTSSLGNSRQSPRQVGPRKRGSYDFDQAMDEDVEVANLSDIDDPNDGLTFVSETASPYSLPLIPANLVDSPQLAVENFYRVFLQRYCSGPDDPTPPFIVCPFDEALSQCFKTLRVADRKPMFIYLHNDHSVAAHIFCNQLLCSRELCQFLEANDLKVWPWDVSLEAAKSRVLRWLEPRFEYLYGEISRMQVDQFPLFIMICKLEGSYEVISLLTGHGFTTTPSTLSWSSSLSAHTNEATPSMDTTFPSLEAALTSSSSAAASARPKARRGNLNAPDVVGELWQKYFMYQERLQPEIMAEEQRAEREFMRMEQDRAYEQSLEQDRLKLEAKQREEAEAERREREMREQEEAAQREARDRQVASTRALPPEPPAGTPGIATIRFRLPTVMPSPPSYEHLPKTEQQPISNGMITRRFRGEDTLLDLKNFMESLGYSVNDFKLLTTFPRVDLTAESADNLTVAELKLVPQETLNLEQR